MKKQFRFTQRPFFLTLLFLLLCIGFDLIQNNAFAFDLKVKNLFHRAGDESAYADYKDLKQKEFIFGSHKMTLEFESEEPLQMYLTGKNDLIIIEKETIKEAGAKKAKTYHMSKLNREGELQSSYQFSRPIMDKTKEYFVHDYLINYQKAYYKTWPLTNSKKAIAMQIWNDQLSWDEATHLKRLKQIDQEAEYIYTIDSLKVKQGTKNKFVTGVLFFKNKQWHILYVSLSGSKKQNQFLHKWPSFLDENLFYDEFEMEWGGRKK